MARRLSAVHRNLDDPLKLGPLAPRSWGIVMVAFALLQLEERLLGFLSVLPPRNGGFLWMLVIVSALVAWLAYVERHEDQHHIPSALRFHLSRPDRYVYSAAAADHRESRPLDDVLAKGRVLSRRRSAGWGRAR